MRYFLRLAYRGEPFHGWQIQPNAVSVQGEIQRALSVILGKDTEIVGAGRTDAGVNASEMFAHFDCDSDLLPRKDSFLRSLNHLCGHDIAFYDLLPVKQDAHARFDALSRTYHYYISHILTPFSRGVSWFVPGQLNYDAMNRAAEILLEINDFTSFAKLHSDVKTNLCNVTEAIWRPAPLFEHTGSMMMFSISANRFLRNMVRAIVGTLVEVGRGKLSQEDFRAVIDAKNRCSAGDSVPGSALYLAKVIYPSEIFI